MSVKYPYPFFSLADEARKVGLRSERTPETWIGNGIVSGYRAPNGEVLINHEEVEAAMRAGRIRDPRKRFGPKARIVPLPITPEDVSSEGVS